jgi:hypothetical protein
MARDDSIQCHSSDLLLNVLLVHDIINLELTFDTPTMMTMIAERGKVRNIYYVVTSIRYFKYKYVAYISTKKAQKHAKHVHYCLQRK